MNKMNGVLEFTVFLAVVIILIILVHVSREKKRKREIKTKFKKFTETYRLSHQEMRAVPRVAVPESMEIILTMTDNEYFGLKACALDVSLSGIAVKPDFPLKKLPLDIIVKNVLVVTPINTFVVREMRTIRIDHQVDKRLMAYHIEKIDPDQFENLKTFIAYLDKFLREEGSETNEIPPEL
jgi:hypothetical protein